MMLINELYDMSMNATYMENDGLAQRTIVCIYI